jgi:rubredoxin
MRLIDADALLTDSRMRMYYHLPNGDIAVPVIDIEHAPIIEERKTGNWVGIDDEPCETFECDVCGFVLDDWIEGAFYNYCPNCGADLRGHERGKQ